MNTPHVAHKEFISAMRDAILLERELLAQSEIHGYNNGAPEVERAQQNLDAAEGRVHNWFNAMVDLRINHPYPK